MMNKKTKQYKRSSASNMLSLRYRKHASVAFSTHSFDMAIKVVEAVMFCITLIQKAEWKFDAWDQSFAVRSNALTARQHVSPPSDDQIE